MGKNDWAKYLQINCRTCALSTPTPESTWTCARYGGAGIPFEAQLQGCAGHVLHPDLVPWKIHDSDDEFTAIYEIDGEMVRNGESDGNVVGSREIVDWTWKVQDEEFNPKDFETQELEQEPGQEPEQEQEHATARLPTVHSK